MKFHSISLDFDGIIDFSISFCSAFEGVCPVPGIIRAGMPKDDSDALEALGFSKVTRNADIEISSM